MHPRLYALILLLSAVGLAGTGRSLGVQAGETDLANTRKGRRPLAAAPVSLSRVAVACRNGVVSLVDLEHGRVLHEAQVGVRLADLCPIPESGRLLVADEAAGQLIWLSVAGDELKVERRFSVGRSPVAVRLVGGGQRAVVACLWSHLVQLVNLESGEIEATTPLPFAPRLLCPLPDGRILVADSFGGRLATLDGRSCRVLETGELAGHNIRGLTLAADGQTLVMAHQQSSQETPLTRENIEQGAALRNVLRIGPPGLLGRPLREWQEALATVPLDRPHAGAGDPAGVVCLGPDRFAVALSGVDQVLFVRTPHGALEATGPTGREETRTAVGRRPAALAALGDGRLAVVNTFGGSISLLDTQDGRVAATIPLSSSSIETPQDRGESAFFDARLSAGGVMSCHSCHTDGHSNGRLADTIGDGTLGTPKRVLTLMGVALTYRWAWNGQIANLHEQVEKSLTQTMHEKHASAGELARRVNDLTAFLHTLPFPPPLAPPSGDEEEAKAVAEGRAAFERHGCADCHIPPLVYSSHESFDVGMQDGRGLARFNPPSLRGVSQNAALFHDNRADSLESVLLEHGHPGGQPISPEDAARIVRFLKTL